jgi:hypothetical protein
MFFESSTPSIVRSVRQRDLLNTWLRLRVRFGGLAPIAEYHPARLDDELKDIVYYVVTRDDAGWRFVIDSNGSRLSQAYGTTDTNNVGRNLRDYVGPRMAQLVLPIYHQCAERALPVYSISLVDDVNGRIVAYERLLMPFSSGSGVTHIIASLKTISEDGKFEINNLLRDPDKLPEYTLRAVIDQELAINQASVGRERSVPGDAPEAQTTDIVEI